MTPSFNVATSGIYSKTPGSVISIMGPARVLMIIYLHYITCFDVFMGTGHDSNFRTADFSSRGVDHNIAFWLHFFWLE